MAGFEKELMLKEVAEKIKGKPYIFLNRFKGIPVNDVAALRRTLEKASKHTFVAKKTLLKKAFDAAGLEAKINGGQGDGSIMLVAAEKDPQIVAKLLVDFAKEKESFKLAGACIDGKLLEASFVKELSRLPSRLELIAKVVGGFKAPITGFVLTTRGLLSSFVNVLDQVAKKKPA